jgi:hypothetical protein
MVSRYFSLRSCPSPSEIALAKSRIIDSPWIAKNSVWIGTRTVSLATIAFIVRNPRLGGVSMMIKSYPVWVLTFGFRILSLAMDLPAISISALPSRLSAGIISSPSISVGLVICDRLRSPIMASYMVLSNSLIAR